MKEPFNLRDIAWKAYTNRRTDAVFEVYRIRRNRSVHFQWKTKIAYETGLAQRASTNPKQFFGHIRTNKRPLNKVVNLKEVNDIRVTDTSSQA